VAEFASAAGDTNPVHRDPEFAAATRYARPIASGTQTTALLLIYADDTIQLEWLAIDVTPNDRLGGDIVDLRRRIKRSDGQTAVGAKGRVLVMAERR
jgi:acyl dehydratase